MKLRGPYLTLAGGLAVGVVLLGLSTIAVDQGDDQAGARQVTVQPAAATPAPGADDTVNGGTPTPQPTSSPLIVVVPNGTYAGRVKGGGASVAVVVKGNSVIAYVCDGAKVEAWLKGSSDSSQVKLIGEASEKLSAKITKGRLVGMVKAGGKKWAFKISVVKKPSGLYRAARQVRKAKVVGGWIVADGKQVGMIESDSGTETAAPPIDLASGVVTIDGVEIRPEAVDGAPLAETTK